MSTLREPPPKRADPTASASKAAWDLRTECHRYSCYPPSNPSAVEPGSAGASVPKPPGGRQHEDELLQPHPGLQLRWGGEVADEGDADSVVGQAACRPCDGVEPVQQDELAGDGALAERCKHPERRAEERRR